MEIQFSKMSGAGNDFVCVDNRNSAIQDGADFAKLVCDRRRSVGADGLLLLEKSDKADFKMMYYNADGSYGGMCGNGGRCISIFATAISVAKPTLTFEALDYIYAAKVGKNYVTLSMKDPSEIFLNKTLTIGTKKFRYHAVNTGSPHIVVPTQHQSKKPLADYDVQKWGRALRYHKRFAPAGANVNFIVQLSIDTIGIRTYERGVESETYACGTGSIASALIAHEIWGMPSPISIHPISGEILRVSFAEKAKKISNVELAGPALITFKGTIRVD